MNAYELKMERTKNITKIIDENAGKTVRFIYEERCYYQPYKCYATERKKTLQGIFRQGGLLYGYTGEYTTANYEIENIKSIEIL